MQADLVKGLDLLNKKLKAKGIFFEIRVCGAFAIELHGFSLKRLTLDIDSHLEIKREIQELIIEVASELGLEKSWMNDQVSDVPLPKGALNRLKQVKSWSNITTFVISTEDIISMKVSAWFTRGAVSDKDIDDLLLLNPSELEIENGIKHTLEAQGIMDLKGKFKTEALEALDDFRNIFRK